MRYSRRLHPLVCTAGVTQQMQAGPLAGYMPYTRQTEGILRGLSALRPQTLAVMHGSSYSGPGEQPLLDLAAALRETFDYV
ncbi:MAG: hypothetical protein WDZ59_07605 [Pirellulales bacterium]